MSIKERFVKTVNGIFGTSSEEESVDATETEEGDAMVRNFKLFHNKHHVAEAEKKNIVENARREAEEIVENARVEAGEIVENARGDAAKIIEKASVQAAKTMEEAKKRVLDNAGDRLEIFKQENEKILDKFESLKAELLLANGKMEEVKGMMADINSEFTKLNQAFPDNMTKKAHTLLFDLFEQIQDTIDTTIEISQKNQNNDLENAAYNMGVFIDMIVEYLADFGIKTIQSCQGDPFSGRCHCLKNKNRQFDPKTAVVKRSVRSGFALDDVVLKKEIIEIMEDE